MSGGVSYIFPSDVETFKKVNALETLEFSSIRFDEEKSFIKDMLEAHFKHTRSNKARQILDQFDNIEKLAIKVIPKDYKLMMQKLI